MTDAEREEQIRLAAYAMRVATTREEKLSQWNRMRELVLGRSRAQVERMERAMGLRAA